MDGPAGLPPCRSRASRSARRAPTAAPLHLLGGLPEGPGGGMGVWLAGTLLRESLHYPLQQQCRRHGAFLFAKGASKYAARLHLLPFSPPPGALSEFEDLRRRAPLDERRPRPFGDVLRRPLPLRRPVRP